MSKTKSKKKIQLIWEYIKSFLVVIGIAILIRAFIIYPFRIPTGSMEDSLLIGDHLIANKFVYGIRTPDWIGIPNTQIGFKVPYTRTPGFRKPKRDDVVIFKYPRNDLQNYIKRCVAVSGDTVEIRAKRLFINGRETPLPPDGKTIYPVHHASYQELSIYPQNAGNRDYYGPYIIPAPGDQLYFSEENKDQWMDKLQIVLYEGNKLTVSIGGESRAFEWKDDQTWHESAIQWRRAIERIPADSFFINGNALDDYTYTVKYEHYFMLGDNRDNSLDSRYWGALPARYIVGEGLVVYWSFNTQLPLYRLFEAIRWNRIFKLIR